MNFRGLKSGLGVALRNTKSEFFSVKKIQELQDKWAGSVDKKEQAYINLLKEMQKQGMHLPTEEEMKADLSLVTEYTQKHLSAGKLSAILDVTVQSTKALANATKNYIAEKFLNTKEVDALVDAYFQEEVNTAIDVLEDRVDRKLRGKKPKPKKKGKHKKSTEKIGPLVSPEVKSKMRVAKSFIRRGPAQRASLKDQLNAIIEHHVQQNMGSSGSPTNKAYLRNMQQNTNAGPFSSTVEVLNVAPRTIIYKYQTRPYSVFDPRVSKYHNLSSAGRNPRRIISAALADALGALRVTETYKYRQDHGN